MSSLFSSLRVDSPEILAIATLIKQPIITSHSRNPSIKWIDLSYNSDSLFLNNSSICIFNHEHEVKTTLSTINTWLKSLPIASLSQPQITFTCCKNGTIILETSTLSPPQIIQLLASLVECLKTQLLYCSQNTHISLSHREVALAHIKNFVTPLLVKLQTTYASYTIKSTERSTSPSSLTSLSTIALLKAPLPHLPTPPTSCDCKETHQCLNEFIESHLELKQLSSLLNKLSFTEELFLTMNQKLSLTVKPFSKKGRHTLMLQSSSPANSELNLLPLTMNPNDIISLQSIIKEQLTSQYLASFLSTPNHCKVCPSILLKKMIGPCLNHQYQELLTIKHQLSHDLLHFTNYREATFLNTISFCLLEIIALFSGKKCQSTSPFTLHSVEETVSKLLHSLASFSSTASFLLKHSQPHNIKTILQNLQKKTRHTKRKITLLQKVAQVNTEPWLEDFLKEVFNTALSTHKTLLEQARKLKLIIDLEYNPAQLTTIDYATPLSLQFLLLEETASFSTKSSLRTNTPRKLHVSFSEDPDEIQWFDPKDTIN
ncbi:hypothetical protein CLAVI_000117 [Candidatus Clavichlamydia salmonicola]|uniref:hypothetical protein n=1 Tax=Candidatus Clavichlamydia salmonicola TaxID=469812 RepID=UPI0018911CE6|nr:hypothetical protein [Candidatus Clavichlamydia salmonicola]MBF5050511.1 hypothetical protein [Candidatus Clavichlamydia salmonicola]